MLWRFTQIEFFVKCNQLDILVLTEAKVTEQITDYYQMNIAGFNVIRCT